MFAVHDFIVSDDNCFFFFFLFGREIFGWGLGNGSSHLSPALPVPNGFGTDNLDRKEEWGLKSTDSKCVNCFIYMKKKCCTYIFLFIIIEILVELPTKLMCKCSSQYFCPTSTNQLYHGLTV